MNIMQPSENPIAIVGSEYCAPYSTDLIVTSENTFSSLYKRVVTDHNNNIIFNVKEYPYSLHFRKVIYNIAGIPIVTLYKKRFSGRGKWHAYRGESSESKDLMFTTKGSCGKDTLLRVYKANNSSKDVPDFKVEGIWWKKTRTIYAGESSILLAQVEFKSEASMITQRKTGVTIKPNTDCAFVAAIVILLEILYDVAMS